MTYRQWFKWQLDRVERHRFGSQMVVVAVILYFFGWMFAQMCFSRDGGYIQPDWAHAGCYRGSVGGDCFYPSTRSKCKDYQR